MVQEWYQLLIFQFWPEYENPTIPARSDTGAHAERIELSAGWHTPCS